MPLLQGKIYIEVSEAARFWDASGFERRPPEDWRRTKLRLRHHISHTWIMNSGYGLVINITDARAVSEARKVARTCPR